MTKVTKQQFSNSVIWKTFNLVFTKGLSMVISIILARQISPEHYGMMTIWSVILSFGDVLVLGGLDTVLIQKEIPTKEDYSSAISLCLLRGIVLYCVLFFLAPIIAAYYEMPDLSILIRLSSLDYFCQPFIMMGTVKSARNMSYKAMFFSDFSATLLGGVLAFITLYFHQDVLVLIANNTSHQVFYAVFLLLYCKDAFNLRIQKNLLPSLITTGSKVMGNGILDLLTSFVSGLFVGKRWNATEVGYSNRGQSLTQILGVETYNVVSNVLLPTFSSYQTEKDQLKAVFRKMVSLTSYIMLPLMFGLALCSKDIILLLYTDKWIAAYPFLQLSCIYYAMNPYRQLCMNLNYSVGKFSTNIAVELFRFIISVALVILFYFDKALNLEQYTFFGSIIAVIVAVLYIITAMHSVNYTISECIKDILPSAALTVAALVPDLFINHYFYINPLVNILIDVMIAAAIYIILSSIFKVSIFSYLKENILAKIRK